MKKKYFLIVLFTIACSTLFAPLYCPADESTDDYEHLANSFMKKIREGKIEGAVTIFFSNNPWMAGRKDIVDQVKSQLRAIVNTLGEYRSYHLLYEKVVAERLVRLSYFAFYDRQPIRFNLDLYKPKDEWRGLYLSFDDQYRKEIDAAGALNMILIE